MAIISHISFSISFTYREIAVFWLNSHWGGNKVVIILQMTICNWSFLYRRRCILIKSHSKTEKNCCSFADDLVLQMLESLTALFCHWWLLTVPLTGHYPFQHSCLWSHTSAPDALRPRQNGPLFSSHMLKTPDLFIMNPLEYELPNSLKISLCALLCYSEGTKSATRFTSLIQCSLKWILY